MNTSLSSVDLINVVVGTLLPLLVGIVTREVTNSNVKAVLLLFLSGVSAVLVEWLHNEGTFDWGRVILAALVTFVVGVASHFGFWKSTGATPALQKTGFHLL